jgi:flagellar motor switch protein FliM
MSQGQGLVTRRKIAVAQMSEEPGIPGADRAWRIAFARAAREQLKLALDIEKLAISQLSLSELLETPSEHSLMLMLEGPGDALGVITLSSALMTAMVEFQTIGRLAPLIAPPRKPTRTDAAMIVPTLDAALSWLEIGLRDQADLLWAGGFRYAAHLDEPRSLGLLLDDGEFHLLRAEICIAGTQRRGELLLALPVASRGLRSADVPDRMDPPQPDFSAALAAQVAEANSVLDAVLARLSLTLAEVSEFAVGQVLALPNAALERISFDGRDGRPLAEGKLGQNRGMRAVRLTLLC